MKPFIAILIAVSALTCAARQYQDGTRIWGYIKPGDDSMSRDGVEITGVSPCTGDIVIPNTIDGLPVVKLNYAMSQGCEELTSITIPSNVKTIGNKAFQSCTGLKKVVFQGSITDFGSEVFSGCTALEDVVLNGGVVTIGESAFMGCTALKEIVIPEGVRELRTTAFYGCTSLRKVVLPTTMTSIAAYCFNGCANICDLSVPPMVDRVTTYWLDARDALTNVVFVGSWASIPSYFCCNCSALVNVGFPADLTKIGISTFSGCSSLLRLDVPSGVITIDANAFYGAGFTEVTIPKTLLSLGAGAFANCTRLLSVRFLGDAPATCGAGIYSTTPVRLTTTVPVESVGWKSAASSELPETWNDRAIVHETTGPVDTPDPVTTQYVYITITNVVIHYVQEIEKAPAVAHLPADGLVAVVSEILGSTAVPVPSSWTNNFPTFAQKFGNDFTAALTKPTGKFAPNGSPLYVWQDFVAGTDPTNPASKFTATIDFVNGHPVINWSPKVDDATLPRIYNVWGKKKLDDDTWDLLDANSINGYDGYNFFKVAVEMFSDSQGCFK